MSASLLKCYQRDKRPHLNGPRPKDILCRMSKWTSLEKQDGCWMGTKLPTRKGLPLLESSPGKAFELLSHMQPSTVWISVWLISATLPSSSAILQGLYNLRSRVRFGKCRKSCSDTSSALRGQICGKKFPQSPPSLYTVFGFCFLSHQSRRLDEARKES